MSVKSTIDSTSRRGFATNVCSQPRSWTRPGAREAEHLAARVAHESCSRAAGTQVEGEKAGACQREREGEREDGVVRVDGEGVDREEHRRDAGERGGQPVHVVEEVERVREP